MKRTIVLIAGLVFSMSAFANGIEFFKGSFDEALQKAAREHKLLFVDVMTTWCGPCKAMAAEVFPKAGVGDFYNQYFVSYQLDAENASMKGPQIADKYGVKKGFPTFLYIAPDGKLKYITGGEMSAEVFIAAGKQALGTDELAGYEAVAKKYRAGNRQPALVRAYIAQGIKYDGLNDWKSDAEEEAHLKQIMKAVHGYFDGRKPESLVNAEDLKLLSDENIESELKLSRGSPLVEYIVTHYEEAAKKVPPEELANFMMDMNYYGILYAAQAKKEVVYKKYVGDIDGVLRPAYAFNTWHDVDPTRMLGAMGDMEYAFAEKNYEAFLDRGWAYVQLSGSHMDAAQLLSFARRLEDVKGGKQYLPGTLKFIQKAYDEYYNLYVAADYGRVLAEMGHKQRARTYYAEALKRADEMGGRRGKEVRERFTKEMKKLGV